MYRMYKQLTYGYVKKSANGSAENQHTGWANRGQATNFAVDHAALLKVSSRKIRSQSPFCVLSVFRFAAQFGEDGVTNDEASRA